VEIRYTITLEDFVEASMLWATARQRERRASLMTSWRGLVFLVILLASGLLISQIRGRAFAWVIVSLLGIYAILIALRKLIYTRSLRRSFEHQNSGLNTRVVIGESGTEVEREGGEVSGRYLWSAFIGHLEGQNTFVLYLNRTQFIIIPKRGMTLEQREELRTLMLAHISERGLKKWR
jgi:hypothetical protein